MKYNRVKNKKGILLNSKFVNIDLFKLEFDNIQTLLITINNPLKLNAINNDILDDLINIFI